MNPDNAPRHSSSHGDAPPPISTAEALSAWLDGEAAAAGELGERFLPADGDLDTWHSYHLIGDVLRAGSPSAFACAEAACASAQAQAFARHVVEQALSSRVADSVPATDLDAAAAGATVLPFVPPQLASVKPPHESPQEPPSVRRAPAANDPVFRWKMAAGFASVAAVMAVAWSVVGGAGLLSGEGAVLATAPAQKATVGAAPSATTFVSAAAPEPVWVNTPQGVVMRDPRMEELMHAHRQAGGGPVLQVPAGFLRAATHDAVQR